MEADALDAERLNALASRELRAAAVHEASHAVLVRRFGGLASPQIWPNASADASQRAWLGTCHIWARPGADLTYQRGLKKSLGIVRTPKRWAVYVGLAGYVGEQLDGAAPESWEIAEAYGFAFECGEISATDLELVGANPSERDFAVTKRYLHRFWADIQDEARGLVVGSEPRSPNS